MLEFDGEKESDWMLAMHRMGSMYTYLIVPLLCGGNMKACAALHHNGRFEVTSERFQTWSSRLRRKRSRGNKSI